MKQALIVDDSRLMLEILREEIKSEKINVKCFANGLDALQWLATSTSFAATRTTRLRW